MLVGLIKRIDKSIEARAIGAPAEFDAALAEYLFRGVAEGGGHLGQQRFARMHEAEPQLARLDVFEVLEHLVQHL